MLRVANSTPIVDLDSRLNSFLVNRESTMGKLVYDEASREAYDFCRKQQKDMVSQGIDRERFTRTTFRLLNHQ
jgi:hypothetical protein